MKVGQRIRKGQVIADGAATDRGELALGRNILVAFMPWGGYNFEDSILISEKIVKDDLFTSIHIEEFEVVARDTKLGREEITRDIPNVGEEALADLDESGIVRIGAEVQPDDILVGKITPKGETQLSPEERLLRAIFGEKAGDVRDTSLRVPPGQSGIVIGARVFSRRGTDKDDRGRSITDAEIAKLRIDQEDEIRIVRESALNRVRELLIGERASVRMADERKKDAWLSPGDTITEEHLAEVPRRKWRDIRVENPAKQTRIETMLAAAEEQASLIKTVFEEKIGRLKKGDELPPGVFKMVKVYVATKRKLSVGDKMAGRHGNKGVISRILPEEDMPYMPNGEPVELVLNPLGVPSRMNIGQILETHLGWAARGLGEQVQAHLDEHYSPAKMRDRLKTVDGEARGQEDDRRPRGRRGHGHGAPARARNPHRDAGLRRPDRGRDQGRAPSRRHAGFGPDRALRRPHRRGVPRRRHGRDHVHDEAAPPGRRQDPRPLDRARTRWSRSSRSAARRSSAGSVSARWRCGRWKPTARPTRCRSSSR